MSRRPKYPVVADGDWIKPKPRGFKHMCCDCALVHMVDIRVKDGQVEMRFVRNKRATAAARRTFRFTREDE